MAPFVDGHCDTVEDGGLAVTGLGSLDHPDGEVVESGGRRGERVSLTVEFLRHWADEPEVDAHFSEVAGNFLNAEHTWFGEHTSVDLGPEVGMSALWWWFTINDALEAVHHGLVVNEDMDRTFSTGSKVDDCQSLSNLCVLGQAMDSRTVVHAVVYTVIDSVSRPSQEGDSLVGTGTVRGCVGPGPASDRVEVRSVGVGLGAFGGRSWDGLR